MTRGCNLLLCMSNPSAKPEGRQRRASAGYEKRDADAKWIFGIVAFLVIAGLIMHFVLAGMMERLGRKPFPGDEWTGARHSAEIVTQAKVFPHLQLKAPED